MNSIKKTTTPILKHIFYWRKNRQTITISREDKESLKRHLAGNLREVPLCWRLTHDMRITLLRIGLLCYQLSN